jgi:hypothetical protein
VRGKEGKRKTLIKNERMEKMKTERKEESCRVRLNETKTARDGGKSEKRGKKRERAKAEKWIMKDEET